MNAHNVSRHCATSEFRKDLHMTPASKKDRALKAVENTVDTVSARTSDISNSVRQDLNDVGHAITNGAADAAATVSQKLKSVGVDTDAMTSAAKEQASELQKLLIDELRTRPLRALGVAAAIGVVVGLMTAR
jgi:ElaB/YqjD/DUF883 family membrane-anchored ribosome-binding protein